MIQYATGDLFKTNADALVNAVNTVGVMGKGIALEFKKRFPANYREYVKACQTGEIKIGRLLAVKDSNAELGERLIINLPTKKTLAKPFPIQLCRKRPRRPGPIYGRPQSEKHSDTSIGCWAGRT